MVDCGREFSFLESNRVRIDIKINISISIRTYDQQIRQAGTSDSNQTNQAGAKDVITSSLLDKLKIYPTTRVSMATKLGQTPSFGHVVL